MQYVRTVFSIIVRMCAVFFIWFSSYEVCIVFLVRFRAFPSILIDVYLVATDDEETKAMSSCQSKDNNDKPAQSQPCLTQLHPYTATQGQEELTTKRNP